MTKTQRASAMNVDTELVRELAELLDETGLTEIEVEDGDRKIRVARTAPRSPPPVQYAAAPAAAPAAAAPPRRRRRAPAARPPPTRSSRRWSAPSISSPEPGRRAVRHGRRQVEAGDTLLIIEAMKVMNPIVAPTRRHGQGDPGRERPAGRVRPAAGRRRAKHHGAYQEAPDRQPRRNRAAHPPRRHEMGIETVAVHSTADADAMHVRLADQAICIGPPRGDRQLSQHRRDHLGRRDHRRRRDPSRLRLPVARTPSSPRSSRRTASSGSGPSPSISARWATRSRPSAPPARSACRWCRARDGAISDLDEAKAIADEIGYPVIIKAASGGGGRGMKVVHRPKTSSKR